MTEQEVARLLVVIAARYPTSKTVQQDEALTVKAWHMTLADVPYEAAERALVDWFKTEKWPPDPSELRNAVAGQLLGLPDVAEAWADVLHHIRSTHMGDAFTGPAPVAKAVAAIGGWRNLRTSERPDKDREAFARAYVIERKRAVEMAVLDRPAIAASRLAALP